MKKIRALEIVLEVEPPLKMFGSENYAVFSFSLIIAVSAKIKNIALYILSMHEIKNAKILQVFFSCMDWLLHALGTSA